MIKDVFLKANFKLWIGYFILVVEYILYSSMPWLLGKSVDSLLLANYTHFYLYATSAFFGLCIGILRRRLDTRIFSTIALQMTEEFLGKMFRSNLCSSKILVRIKKINLFTQFAEYTIPSVVRSSIYILVSFACLFSMMGSLTFCLFGVMLTTIITSHLFSTRIEKCIEASQLIEEQKEKAIIERRENEVMEYCRTSRKLDVKISDIQAANWGVVDICCIICELGSILILTLTKTPSPGEIMSSFVYVQSLCGYFQIFPSIIEQLKHLKVASKFLKQDG